MMNYKKGDIIELKDGNHIEYETLIIKLAVSLFVETSNNTTTNNWTTYFEELEQSYELEDGFIDREIADDIISKLYELFPDMIAEDEIYYEEGGYDEEAGYYKECDRYFDITLYENFCTGYVEDDQCIEENRNDED